MIYLFDLISQAGLQILNMKVSLELMHICVENCAITQLLPPQQKTDSLTVLTREKKRSGFCLSHWPLSVSNQLHTYLYMDEPSTLENVVFLP